MGPDGDPRRTFRRAISISVVIVCFLYMTTNVAFVSASSSNQMNERTKPSNNI